MPTRLVTAPEQVDVQQVSAWLADGRRYQWNYRDIRTNRDPGYGRTLRLFRDTDRKLHRHPGESLADPPALLALESFVLPREGICDSSFVPIDCTDSQRDKA